MRALRLIVAGLFCMIIINLARAAQVSKLGPFSHQTDIGTASTAGPGKAEHDDTTNSLNISGGGANIWATDDDFHFVWKKATGDITLAATIQFPPAAQAAVPHRKVVLMVRQSLDRDSVYADACLHGNGMTALQWRAGKGEISYQIQADANTPRRLQIEKRGDYFSMSLGTSDADMQPAGGSCKVPLEGEYYIGIGVCSHSKDLLETVNVSDISFGTPLTEGNRAVINTLEVYQVSSRDRKAVYVQTQARRFEAPNWGSDDLLYFNNNGRLYKVKADLPGSNPPAVTIRPEPMLVDLGILNRLNNDHVLSFDKATIAVSDQSQGNRQSSIWTVPLTGGAPRRITQNTPSYGHGWSPDGKTLVFAGQRAGNWDIYSIASDGSGEERRLTDTPGREDGPEYSPDGQFIYFNSERTGKMQIWRMKPDGSSPEQITHDETHHNWFPHISPNGEQMVFLSYELSVKPDDHPENKEVLLQLMNLKTGATTVVAKLFGGQGTINVPSWSPDSKCFAFVSYQIVQQ